MKLSLDKSKCGWFYRFYQYILTRFFGIGCTKVKWEDFLYSYVMINHAFLPSATTTTPSVTTQFVGIVTSDGTLLPGETTVAKFYMNDQAAFDDGVEIGQIYYLSLDNTYGMPYGTPKKLVENVE